MITVSFVVVVVSINVCSFALASAFVGVGVALSLLEATSSGSDFGGDVELLLYKIVSDAQSDSGNHMAFSRQGKVVRNVLGNNNGNRLAGDNERRKTDKKGRH